MSNPLISVCINTQNEGGRVLATVNAFHEHLADCPHEIIVCDDATDDGCCNGLPAKVLRNDTRIGCGRSKRRMTEAATGDVLCFVDSHQAPLQGSLKDMALRLLNRERPAAITPLSQNIVYDDQWKHRVPDGARRFSPSNVGLPPESSGQYRVWNQEERPSNMVGVGVTIRRQDLLNLGGWCNFEGRRGSQEMGLALKLFMAGYDVETASDVVFGHEYGMAASESRKRFPYQNTSYIEWAKCRWHAWAVVLRKETFEQHVMPDLMKHKQARVCPGHHLEPHVAEERDWFAANAKRRDDHELLDLIAEIRERDMIPPDTGGGALEPASLAHVRQYAIGRCLEFGTGTGASAKAMLESDKATVVVSVEDVPKWTVKASATIKDPRAMFVVLKRNGTGFYDVEPLRNMGMQFDFVLIDGPPGTKARADAFPTILPLLASGATVLVDDGNRDIRNIQRWQVECKVQAEKLPSHRGLYRIVL